MPGTELFFALLGSVALLLWGVRMVRTGMMRAFGGSLRRLIAARVTSRIKGLYAGLLVTGLLQSSTATAILLASFAGRGLIAPPIALAVMLGADVGSTMVAQVFSFSVYWLWSLPVGAGVVLFMLSERDKTRAMARVAIGLGLMLLALSQLGAAAATLRESATFRILLTGLAGEPLLAFIVAAAVTWLLHSSLSIVLLIMTLAAAQAIPTPLALALVLGANVGGALAPLLSLSGSQRAVVRVPLGNVVMRLTIALPALFLVTNAAELLGMIKFDPGRLVINFHSGFNLAVALLFLPFTGVVAKMVELMLPDAPAPAAQVPRHLDQTVLDTPSDALACAMRETLALGDKVAQMLHHAIDVFEHNDPKLMRQVEKTDDAVDDMYEAIKLYLVKVPKTAMSDEESRRYVEILTFTTNLEHVGDIIDKNLMELAGKKIKHRFAFSPEGSDDIRRMHARVTDNMQLALNVFATRDISLARRLLTDKTSMRSVEMQAADSHFRRLHQGRLESIETSSIHLDVIRDLKRINAHLTSVAYPILEAAGELRPSRLRDTVTGGGPPEVPGV